jgi:hypothetical protein
MSPYLTVCLWGTMGRRGGRGADVELGRVHNEYGDAVNYTEINFCKGVSAWLAGPVLALRWPHGMARRAS